MSVALEELLVNLAQQIIQQEQQKAQQATLDTVMQQGSATLTLLQQVNTTVLNGLASMQSKLDRLLSITSAIQNDQVGTLGRGLPVTLPTAAPPGYGGATGPQAANAVWDYFFTFSGLAARETLAGVYGAVFNAFSGAGMIPLANQRHLWFEGDVFDQLMVGGNTFPLFSDDLSLAVGGDTPLSWIQRLNPAYVWANATNGCPFADVSVGGITYRVIAVVDQAMIDQAVYIRGAPTSDAPVWPGLAGASITGPVALVDGLAITRPMSGVIVTITSVSPPVGFYAFGPIKSYVKVGSVLFENDDSDFEAAQGFGVEDQIIACKTMAVAQSCRFRVKSGVVGEVWTWLRN